MHSQCWGQRQRQLTVQLSFISQYIRTSFVPILSFFFFCIQTSFFLFFFFFFLFFFFFFTFIHFTAYQILVPWPGIKLMPPGLGGAGSKPQDHQGTPSCSLLLTCSFLPFLLYPISVPPGFRASLLSVSVLSMDTCVYFSNSRYTNTLTPLDFLKWPWAMSADRSMHFIKQ